MDPNKKPEPSIFARIDLQRPEVRAKMRQLVGIYQGLTQKEQSFIVNKLITHKKPE